MNKFKDLFYYVRDNIGLAQNIDEITWAVKEARKIKPEVIVEIGMAQGGTLKFWEYVLENAENPLLIGIDIVNKVKWKWDKSSVEIHLIIGSSLDPKAIDKVNDILNGREIDVLFIDGDHSYDVCKKDYERYSPFVRKGGLIIFHDTNIDKNSVGKVFSELQGKKEKLEIGQGTGLYYV